MATAVFGRLVQIQVIEGKSLAAQAASTHTTSITLQATRGEILDRNGRVLVSNVQVFDVFADPALITASDRASVAGMLAPILQVSSTQILARAAAEQPVRLPRQGRLPGRQRQAPGARPERHRHDPVGGERLRAVAGPGPVLRRPTCSASSTPTVWVSTALEGYYNSHPRPAINGHESTLTDVNGNAIVLGRQQKVPAENGDNLELGLDSQIQY